jgi:type IV secretory pathway TrbL component
MQRCQASRTTVVDCAGAQRDQLVDGSPASKRRAKLRASDCSASQARGRAHAASASTAGGIAAGSVSVAATGAAFAARRAHRSLSSPGRRVRISTPSAVTATVCSHCADSAVLGDHGPAVRQQPGVAACRR